MAEHGRPGQVALASPQKSLSPVQNSPSAEHNLLENVGNAITASVFAPLTSQMVVQEEQGAAGPAPADAAVRWFYQPWYSVRTFTQIVAAILLIWIFQWLYLSAVWDPLDKMSGLVVKVLNCDYGVNSTVVQTMPQPVQAYAARLKAVPLATQLMSATVYNGSNVASRVLNWQPYYCGGYSVGCGTAAQEAQCWQHLQEDVLQGRQWAGWYWPGNTSMAHMSSFNVTGTAAALVAPSRQLVVLYQTYARGRNYSTYSFILILMTRVTTGISQVFGTMLAMTGLVTMGLFYPTSLVPSMQVSQVDLAPVNYFGQNMACYVCCLLAWLGSAFCVALSSQHKLPVEMQALDATSREMRPPFKKICWALTIKAVSCGFAMFVLSCLLILCVMALGTAAGGGAQFYYNPGVGIAFIWWLTFTYIAINGLLLHALGIERFNSISALLLILQLMSSGGIMSEDTSPGFFYCGRALPFYYGVRGLRTIFWGVVKDAMWVNWVVLLGWNIVTSAISWVFIAHKIHKSGSTARPNIAPLGTVGDGTLASGL